ncbi:MAG: glycerate kinase [Pseudomonadota bacterium]
MKILVACDKFRGALTSLAANEAIARAVREVFPKAKLDIKRIADGGEGTSHAFIEAYNGELITSIVENPFGKSYEAYWGWVEVEKTAIIEISAMAGHHCLLGDALDPTCASSYGLGQVIAQALDRGVKKFIIGLGGSVTIDGGAGVLEALGVRFISAQGERLSHVAGTGLSQISRIDFHQMDPRLSGLEFIIAADIDSPLHGKMGAVQMFGEQKGLQRNDFEAFEQGLSHFDQCLAKALNRAPLADQPGAGAAGGLYLGLSALIGVNQSNRIQIKNGFDLLSKAYGFDERIHDSDLILTGEGAFDNQSLVGKGTGRLAKLAKQHRKPLIVFTGKIDINYIDFKHSGVTAIFPIAPRPISLDDALRNASMYLNQSAYNALSVLKAGGSVFYRE